jgi:hypothetical protein
MGTPLTLPSSGALVISAGTGDDTVRVTVRNIAAFAVAAGCEPTL